MRAKSKHGCSISEVIHRSWLIQVSNEKQLSKQASNRAPRHLGHPCFCERQAVGSRVPFDSFRSAESMAEMKAKCTPWFEMGGLPARSVASGFQLPRGRS